MMCMHCISGMAPSAQHESSPGDPSYFNLFLFRYFAIIRFGEAAKIRFRVTFRGS